MMSLLRGIGVEAIPRIVLLRRVGGGLFRVRCAIHCTPTPHFPLSLPSPVSHLPHRSHFEAYPTLLLDLLPGWPLHSRLRQSLMSAHSQCQDDACVVLILYYNKAARTSYCDYRWPLHIFTCCSKWKLKVGCAGRLHCNCYKYLHIHNDSTFS